MSLLGVLVVPLLFAAPLAVVVALVAFWGPPRGRSFAIVAFVIGGLVSAMLGWVWYEAEHFRLYDPSPRASIRVPSFDDLQ